MFNIHEALPCEDFLNLFHHLCMANTLFLCHQFLACRCLALIKKSLKKTTTKHLINFCKLSDYAFAVRSRRLDEATTPGANMLALGTHKYR